MKIQEKLHRFGNILGLVIICLILFFILAEQYLYHDLPCPLCLLQRICYISVGICLVMNLCLGISAAHYGYMLLGALSGLAVSTRQIFIHLTGPGYGTPFLGWYLYVWAAVGFIIILVLIAIALILEKGFSREYQSNNKWIRSIIGLFFILILINGISTFVECGFHVCPDNPVNYYF